MTGEWRRRIGLAVLAGGVSAMAGACTTFGRRGEPAGGDGAGEAVVAQIGRREAVAAPKDRKYYLELRQAKQLMPRLHGALATGEGEAAVSYARQYLSSHPGDANAMTMLATALILTRKYDLAAYYAMQVEKARSGDAAALNIQGMAAMLSPGAKVADYHRAMALFRQAIAADGGQVAAALNLGSLELELGDAKSAVQSFGTAAERCRSCTPALMGLGIASARTGNHAGAVTAFQEVIKQNPRHSFALYNLALVYKNGYNDRKQAEKYLFVLLDKARPEDSYIRGRAQTLLRMVKGEATPEERRALAEDDEPVGGAGGTAGTPADDKDAELLMTEFQDGE